MNSRLARSLNGEREPAPLPSRDVPPSPTPAPQAGPRSVTLRERRPAAGPAPKVKVDLRDVEFYYGKFKALHGITLPLHDRRVTAFVGPSGCGKSTLLRILNRIYQLYPGQVAAGEVLVDGVDILGPGIDLNLLRARVGMVFQKPTPFPM